MYFWIFVYMVCVLLLITSIFISLHRLDKKVEELDDRLYRPNEPYGINDRFNNVNR